MSIHCPQHGARVEEPGVPRKMLALVATGQFLGMTLWFSASAAAPAIAREFAITGAGVAWLTMAVQGGFVIGTLCSALTNLADLLNARRLFAAGCLIGAAANAAIPFAASSSTIIVLRFTTGAALACVYPPGMKIVAGWFLRGRGEAMGILIGALTAGTALPHLIVWAAADVPWRASLWVSSALAVLGGAIVATAVRDGPHVSPSGRFDPHAVRIVLRDRRVRLATLGYLGHMWELYAMWTWFPTFAAASLVARGGAPSGLGSLLGFAAIASGALGCVLAGRWADQWGKARTAAWAMLASASCSLLAGAVFGGPPALLALLAVVWGFSVVADSAQFSALVTEFSPTTHVGTALTIQTCAGFLLTMVSLPTLSSAVDVVDWTWAFLILTPGPVLGALAMRKLR